MTGDSLSDDANQRQKGSQHGADPSLQPSRRANAAHLTHEEPEIEAARVDQRPLPNVDVTAEVHTPHAGGLTEMRKRPLQAFSPRSRSSR